MWLHMPMTLKKVFAIEDQQERLQKLHELNEKFDLGLDAWAIFNLGNMEGLEGQQGFRGHVKAVKNFQADLVAHQARQAIQAGMQGALEELAKAGINFDQAPFCRSN